MKRSFLTFLAIAPLLANAQLIDSLNTAKNCLYMKPEERKMIYEINRLRNNPASYLQYIQPRLDEARAYLKRNGKGARSYSLTYKYAYTPKGREQTIDTNWHYSNEEEVNALASLVNDLKKLKKLSVLRPDSGIYNAAKKHEEDQNAHDWQLMHEGSDGSSPWDRITKFSPGMSFGNENIAGQGGMETSPLAFVILLLIDSGIPGYGHRYNLLDPQWTHVACVMTNFKGMNWCIQNFGAKKKVT